MVDYKNVVKQQQKLRLPYKVKCLPIKD